jgi:hypothetical protein
VFIGLIPRSALTIFGMYVATVILILIKISFHYGANWTPLTKPEEFMNSASNKQN